MLHQAPAGKIWRLVYFFLSIHLTLIYASTDSMQFMFFGLLTDEKKIIKGDKT